MTYDLGASYRAARERITVLIEAHVDGLDRAVPATPEWTAHDVLAHIAGITHDAGTGNMAGAPGDAWTQAQVDSGRTQSAAALLALWAEHAPGLEALLSSPNGAMVSAAVMDIHCHEADLRHAFGHAADLPVDFLTWAGASMREQFANGVAAAGLGLPAVSIDDFEWFRARLGRRTEAEVRAYAWTLDGDATDATPYLDAFFIFGRAATSLGEVARR